MMVHFIQKRGEARRYRRRVPESLQAIIGKREITIPLGSSDAEALKRYPAVHDYVEKLLAQAAVPVRQPLPPTLLDHYRAAHTYITKMGLDPAWTGPDGPYDPEDAARGALADEIVARYGRDEEGRPTAVSLGDQAVLNALGGGQRDQRPVPTLEDARRLYLADKVKEDDKRQKQLDRIFSLVADVVKLDMPITGVRRSHAREIRDHLLDGRTAASVRRYLNTLRAALTHTADELEVKGFTNPFSRLSIEDTQKGAPERRKRDSFTEEELRVTRAHIMSSSERDDLKLIWRLLEGTGCRGAEIAGLRTVDVKLNHAIPHIAVEWHDKRRIKTTSSIRVVPLLGDTLEAAKEAVEAAKGQEVLFPAYCREGGPDSLSAALGKHVRACVSRKKVVTYSLRHRITDGLRLANVSRFDEDTRGPEGYEELVSCVSELTLHAVGQLESLPKFLRSIPSETTNINSQRFLTIELVPSGWQKRLDHALKLVRKAQRGGWW